jgi:hypothetical protein
MRKYHKNYLTEKEFIPLEESISLIEQVEEEMQNQDIASHENNNALLDKYLRFRNQRLKVYQNYTEHLIERWAIYAVSLF